PRPPGNQSGTLSQPAPDWRTAATTRRRRCSMIESSRNVFKGRVLTLNLEQVRLPNGQVAELEIAHHPGGAAVVAVDAEGRVCLLRQFRHAAGGWLTELPAGKLDGGEPPLECARRELAEEAGVSARRWEKLGEFFSSP